MRLKTSGVPTPAASSLGNSEKYKMQKLVLAATIAAVTSIAGLTSTAFATVIPCEDMLVTLRDAVKTAKLNDADKAKVDELEAKGVERCNADDDKRADAFFADALKLAAKK